MWNNTFLYATCVLDLMLDVLVRSLHEGLAKDPALGPTPFPPSLEKLVWPMLIIPTPISHPH